MITYKQKFESLDRGALIPFFVIGDPDLETSFEIVKAAIDAGADVLELGIPFSDPIADGPTIQAADMRALESGVTPAKALEFIKRVTDYKDIPIGLLVYYNLIYRYGAEKFMQDFAAAGGNSALIADLCIDDAAEVEQFVKDAGLDTVYMVTPNTADERLERIVAQTSGFVYTVAVLGVTGSRDSLSDMVKPLIKRLKAATQVPVCVGFGISKPAHAVDVLEAGADGVIVGSRLVRIIEENLGNKSEMIAQISKTLKEFKEAIG